MTRPAVLVIAYELDDDSSPDDLHDAVRVALDAIPVMPGHHRPPTVTVAIEDSARRVLEVFDR